MNDKQTLDFGQGKENPDFRLLIQRLQNAIIHGKDREKCLKLLGRHDIWTRLEAKMQLQWANLAQMIGEVELALQVLSHINKTTPEMKEAWSRRIELLSLLGRKQELVRVSAEAREFCGEDRFESLGLTGIETSIAENLDPDKELEPFLRLKQREELLDLFLDLFSGREDCFARQWADKSEGTQGYVPVRRPMQPGDVEEHLSGKKTYGIYLLRSDSTVKVAVLDVDIVQSYRGRRLNAEEKSLIRREKSYLFARINELSEERGLYPVPEFSGGKGYHFWFFFQEPLEAQRPRRILESVKNLIAPDLSAFEVEVFPKQDTVSVKGLGNLVKLPLGIHRLTGKRSYFMSCQDRNPDAQLRFLREIKRSIPKPLSPQKNQIQVLVHPKLREWAKKFPELAALETRCPPIGQILASCRAGHQLSMREEKIIFQTIGFLRNARTLLHHLFRSLPEYNPHLVDYRLSRVRGKPLGCKRIHSLTGYAGDFCPFERPHQYPHPLLHLEKWDEDDCHRSEKVEDLKSALENLKQAIAITERFLE